MDKSFEWFNQARFGLMLHWGLYTQLAGEYRGRRMDYIGEWIQSRFEIPNEEYSRLTQAMNPIGFCAEDWVKLAKSAGMEYIVLTSKHHEGFAMYRSEADPFNIADATPFGRDPIAELAEACQKHSMRLGLYYSQELDWHEPDGGGYTRGHTNHGMSWTNDWDFPDNDKKDFSRCFERKIKPQVKELLTKYGDLALIWFDTPGVITPEQSRELYDMVKAYQPHCLVNSRIGNGMGDYFSLGDNQVPAGAGAKDRLYETAATLNDTWGYKAFDQNWKTADQTISLLTRLASRNTNYLLNVGPDTLGRIPAAAQDILRAVGDWMQAGGRDAVHGCGASPFPMDLSSGPVTKKGNKLYFFLNNPVPGGSFKVNGIEGQAARSYLTRQKRPLVQVQHPMRGLDGLSLLEKLQQRRLHAAAVSLERHFERQAEQGHQAVRLLSLPGGEQPGAYVQKFAGVLQPPKIRRISDQAQAAQRFHPHRRAHQLGLSARLSQLAAYNAQQRTFSRAVSAQKAHHLARGHRKIQAVQRHGPTKAPCKATCADGGCSF